MGIEFDNIVRDPKYYLMEEGYEQARHGGTAAALLGLPPTFDPVVYDRLIRGLNPHDGSQLTDRKRSEKSRGLIDITVTAPKAVTIPYLLGGDDRIQWAYEDAKAYALSLIEKQTCIRDQSGGKNDYIFGTGVAYLSVPHKMTRPAKDDGIEDPHLHDHALFYNIGPHHKAGGTKWRALEFGSVNRALVDDEYHERLAGNMRTLGYRSHWDGKEFHVYGISREMQDVFSRRHKECVETKDKVVKEVNKAKAAVISRSEKNIGVKVADRIGYWVDKLTRRQLGQLRDTVEKARFGYSRTRARAAYRAHVVNRLDLAMVQEPASHTLERGRENGGVER